MDSHGTSTHLHCTETPNRGGKGGRHRRTHIDTTPRNTNSGRHWVSCREGLFLRPCRRIYQPSNIERRDYDDNLPKMCPKTTRRIRTTANVTTCMGDSFKPCVPSPMLVLYIPVLPLMTAGFPEPIFRLIVFMDTEHAGSRKKPPEFSSTHRQLRFRRPCPPPSKTPVRLPRAEVYWRQVFTECGARHPLPTPCRTESNRLPMQAPLSLPLPLPLPSLSFLS